MGGMGRSFDGSYAEYALLPEHHVFTVESDLPWEQLGAVPETYFTAWGSLFECLQLKPKDTLLVRGATCALGYAVIQLAKALGCRAIGTTHRESKFSLLEEAGADEVVLDEGVISGKKSFPALKSIPSVTDVGTKKHPQRAVRLPADILYSAVSCSGFGMENLPVRRACSAKTANRAQLRSCRHNQRRSYVLRPRRRSSGLLQELYQG